jgi:hypothetical protein
MESTAARRSILSSGQAAVIGMLALAVLAAGFAWLWNFNRGRVSLDFYGPQAARLIRTSPKVEILIVGGPESAGGAQSTSDFIAMHRRQQPVFRRIDISRAAGLLNARTSLLDDASYATEPSHVSAQSFTKLIRFSDGKSEVLLAITDPDGLVEDVSRGKSMQLVKKTADGWRAFIARNTATPAHPSSEPEK